MFSKEVVRQMATVAEEDIRQIGANLAKVIPDKSTIILGVIEDRDLKALYWLMVQAIQGHKALVIENPNGAQQEKEAAAKQNADDLRTLFWMEVARPFPQIRNFAVNHRVIMAAWQVTIVP